jgi:hypothetical protein
VFHSILKNASVCYVSNYCTGIQTLSFVQVLDDSAGQLLTVLDIEIAEYVMEDI